MVKIICKRKICGHVWDYNGQGAIFVTCARCHARNRLAPWIEKARNEYLTRRKKIMTELQNISSKDEFLDVALSRAKAGTLSQEEQNTILKLISKL